MSTKITTKLQMKRLREGDIFYINGESHIATTDAHKSEDASVDCYIVYDEIGNSYFDSDFPERNPDRLTMGTLDTDIADNRYEYTIVYSNPQLPNIIRTWSLPKASFIINYKAMKERGCIIHNVLRSLTPNEIWDVLKE